MNENKNIFFHVYVLATILVIGIGLLVYLMLRAKRLKEERLNTIAKIKEALQSGAGEENGDDASNTLLNVKSDPNYNGIPEAQKLKDAMGTVWDDDETVFEIIKGKSKAKLKSIELGLQGIGYKSWDDYLKTIFNNLVSLPFGYCAGIDCDKYNKALNMIKAAK
ncbi:MAG: hypothetical protein RL711_481 [Bacteroidota bacterium]|jgi:hypothetical protein